MTRVPTQEWRDGTQLGDGALSVRNSALKSNPSDHGSFTIQIEARDVVRAVARHTRIVPRRDQIVFQSRDDNPIRRRAGRSKIEADESAIDRRHPPPAGKRLGVRGALA